MSNKLGLVIAVCVSFTALNTVAQENQSVLHTYTITAQQILAPDAQILEDKNGTLVFHRPSIQLGDRKIPVATARGSAKGFCHMLGFRFISSVRQRNGINMLVRDTSVVFSADGSLENISTQTLAESITCFRD